MNLVTALETRITARGKYLWKQIKHVLVGIVFKRLSVWYRFVALPGWNYFRE